MSSQVFKLADLFCGPGGLSLGLISATTKSGSGEEYKIKSVWANDIDEDSCKTYARNIHGGHSTNVICAPVETIDFNEVPKFDVVAFGFPCNDFSVVGEQQFVFSSGFTLAPEATVKVTSGTNAYTDPPNVLQWLKADGTPSKAFIWNNDGDPARLFDNLGNLVSTFP